MAYTKASIANLKDNINIVEVVGRAIELKRSGANYKGVCPFHNEKTPSFNVNENRQGFYCFGCQASGDVFEFVQRYYNLEFNEACERLSREYGIALEETRGGANENFDKYYEINREATAFFFSNLTEKKNKGYPYMKNRGIKDSTIKIFGIGYADDTWDSLYKYLKSKGYDEKEMLELGLISESNGKYFDKFRNRVIFPIINTRGKVIGFGGRAISSEDNPKYLNSQESKAFRKKNNLFGLNLSKDAVHKEGYIILVEGYMDVIGLYQSGIKNVSASLGTALTESQAKLIKRHTGKVILCYDSDNAGRQAALRGMEILRTEDLDIRVMHVTDGKDPDEFIKNNGREAFLQLVDNADHYGEYKIRSAIMGLNLNDHQDRIKAIKNIGRILRSLTPAEREEYASKFSKELDISKAVLLQEAEETKEKEAGSSVRRKPATEQNITDKISKTEEELFRLILRNDAYVEKTLEVPELIETDIGLRIFETMKACLKEENDLDTTKLLDRLEEDDRIVIYGILENVVISQDESKIFEGLVKRNKINSLQKEVERINDILRYAGESEAETDEMKALMRRSMELQREIMEERAREQ